MITRLLAAVSKLLPCREIHDDAGTLYLQRFRIVGDMMARHDWFPFTAYLHRFHRPDEDRVLHNHPWPWAVSCILAGGYREERSAEAVFGMSSPQHVSRWLRAGSLNLLRGDTFHRVAELDGETWTLFIVGRKHQNWGFDVPGRGFVPWRQHEEEARAARRTPTMPTYEETTRLARALQEAEDESEERWLSEVKASERSAAGFE